MQIDESDGQPVNVDGPMRVSLLSHSNVTVARESASQKQYLTRSVTEAGMVTAESNLHSENAESPMDESFDPASNVSVERCSQPKKH
jgi:hypothetical protein